MCRTGWAIAAALAFSTAIACSWQNSPAEISRTTSSAPLPNRGVNFAEWVRTPIWKDAQGCTGNLPMSLTGTLGDPLIGEDGRQFLARLLARLSDRQIRDLFEVSRFQLRSPAPDRQVTAEGNIDAWVGAFKQKRDEIASHRCPGPIMPRSTSHS